MEKCKNPYALWHCMTMDLYAVTGVAEQVTFDLEFPLFDLDRYTALPCDSG